MPAAAQPGTRLRVDTEPETVLPYLTVEGGPAIALARSFFASQLSADPSDELLGAAEVAARIGLSLVLAPESHFNFDTDDEVRAFARRCLVPLLPT